MLSVSSSCPGRTLDADDVAQAWLIWSGAAETALVDVYRLSGGPRVGVRGRACFMVMGEEGAG